MDMSRRVGAEFFGTFWLVFGGCGAAVLAATFPAVGIGWLGVAFAFGLTVLTMAYAVGHISGGHFNPAVTIGLWSAGRCANKHVIPYIIAQVVGAIVASYVLWTIASGKPGWVPGGFASNGYGDLSPGKYSLGACVVDGIRDDVLLPADHCGNDLEGCRQRLCRHPDWTGTHTHPSRVNSGHQYIGKSCAQHWTRAVCRWRVCRPALDVLGRAIGWCRRGRLALAVDV